MEHRFDHLSFLIVTFSLIVVTIQRDINDDFIAPHRCKSIMKEALDYCQPQLTENANLMDQDGQSIEKIDLSLFNCCNYAQFKLCMESDMQGKCDYELNLTIKTQAIYGVKRLSTFCGDDYNYYSPTCQLTLYLYYFIIIGLTLILIGLVLVYRSFYQR